MSGKDHKKSPTHYKQRVLSKEHNSGNPDNCMAKVGSVKSGKNFIVKQLLDLGYKRLSSREFENPETGAIRVIPR